MSQPTNLSTVDGSASHNQTAARILLHEEAYIKGIKITAYTILLAVSLIGNLLLIAVIYKNYNHRMRTSTNYFIFNMACSDILFTAYSIPQNIATTANNSQWLIGGVAGEFFCRLFYFISHMSLLVSTGNLFVIAWDRFLLVFFPLRTFITLRIARRIIITIWVLGMIFCLPLLKLSAILEVHGQYRFCHFNFSMIEFVFFYFVFFFTSVIALPLLLTIILYIAIGIKLRRTKIPGDNLSSTQERRDRMNCTLLIMLLTVVTVLIFCRFPLLVGIVACFTRLFGICTSPEVIFVGWFLTLANSAINPWIYFVFNENFRHGAKLILKREMPCCFHSTNEVGTAQSVGMTLELHGSEQRYLKLNKESTPRTVRAVQDEASYSRDENIHH